MEADQDILHEFKFVLGSIVSGSDLEVKEGWIKLEKLEQNVQSTQSSNYVDVLRDIQKELLHGQVENIREIPQLLMWFAKYLKNPDPNFSDDLAAFLRNSKIDDISILESILRVFENKIYLNTNTSHKKLCKAIVNSLANFQMPRETEAISKYNSSVEKIQDYLKPFKDQKNLTVCLEQLYCIISTKPTPGYAACIVLLLVDKPLIADGVRLLLNSPYKDQELVKALTVISEWLLKGRHNELLAKWLMTFIQGLESERKFSILMKIAETALNLQNVCCAFILPKQSQTVGKIYLYMLQRQNNVSLFHKFIATVEEKRILGKNVFEILHSQDAEYARETLQNMVDVLEALIMRFPGHDELYTSLRRSFPVKPREDIVKEILRDSFWSDEKEKLQISCLPERSRINIMSVDCLRSDDSKVGLANLGNTCYMNSVLQALAMTRQFRYEVLNYKVSDLASQVLLRKLQNLFALLMYSKRSSLSPSEILQVSRPAYFLPGQQQDSSEFLCHLLDVLYEQEKSAISISGSTETMVDLKPISDEPMDVADEDVAASDESVIKRWTTEEDLTEGEEMAQTQHLSDSHSDSTDSGIQSVGGEDVPSPPSILVHRVFGGESKITYQCAQCDNSSDNTDKFRDLQLCFPEEIQENQEVRVQDLINYYLTPEKLTGDNKYRCDKCMKLCDAQRIIKILQAPNHLILTLKHFRYDSESRLRAKLRHKVRYDETIQLALSDSSPETYRLYAAVVHSGYSMDYGHYITYACDSKQQWYRFNDSYVSSCTTFQEFKRLEPPDTPYILFYERCTSAGRLFEEEEDRQELSSLSKHIQDIVEADTKTLYSAAGYRDDRKRTGYHLSRHDNSDDDNPPSSTCRGRINIQSNNYLW
ncbi:ubiquitin carboxyl-terminal hydrolase 35 isoform X2 [Belonocnema kinseyi]|uniref:ubiquitin carboxyl-terminal hydrolase 35 isoform X2 n=1 Tax=Belonocnema kinseyi TaxID=2817044 RepID=UPI00143D299F|nr:ubiquitin carboxyl-terminal hydrolase 35 isoform X2 [Belonocnema kinseyi]